MESVDFDRVIDRVGSNSIAVDGFRDFLFDGEDVVLPCADGDAIAMWVADMAFATPLVAREAMRRRLEHPIFGYTVPLDGALDDAFSGWCRRHYDWEPDRDHLVTAAGVVPALFDLVAFIVEPGQKVVTHTPAYEPFELAVNNRGGELVTVPLARTDTGEITFDMAALERHLADPAVRMFLLCHPHNPTGRVWRSDELRAMAECCFENDVLVIADEIHCDLIRTGRTHTPLATLFPDSDQVITCMSSSKTFNLAGLGLANIVIPNDAVRAAWEDRHFPVVNPLSEAAATAVFNDGDPWLDGLRRYLDDNFAVVRELLADRLPDAGFAIPDATYLAWIDLSAYLDPASQEVSLTSYFAEMAGVLVEGGEKFVADADGFIRINLACPRAVVSEAMGRIIDATLAGPPPR